MQTERLLDELAAAERCPCMRHAFVLVAAAFVTFAGCDDRQLPTPDASASATPAAVAPAPTATALQVTTPEIPTAPSTRAPAAAAAGGQSPAHGPLSFTKFAHVVHAGAPYAIVATHPPGPAQLKDWLIGSPQLMRVGKPTITLGQIDPTRVPPELVGLRGKRLRLMSAAGVACIGTIDGFAVIGRVSPHFGMAGTWTGSSTGTRLPPKTVAEQAWAQSNYALAARVDAPDCRGALWAHEAGDVAPTVATSATADAAQHARALAAFRQLGAWAKLQSEYGAAGYRGAHWDAAGDSPAEVTRWQLGQRAWLAVRANVIVDGCGGFMGSMLAIFQMDAERLSLVNDPSELAMFARLDGAIAFDGGAVGLLYEVEMQERGLLRGAGGSLRRNDVDSWPYLDCDC